MSDVLSSLLSYFSVILISNKFSPSKDRGLQNGGRLEFKPHSLSVTMVVSSSNIGELPNEHYVC